MGQARAVISKRESPIQKTEPLQADTAEETKSLDEKIAELKSLYLLKQPVIRARLSDFESIWLTADNFRLFEELVFCIFTAGASARMGLNCIERIRPILLTGTRGKLTRAVLHKHRYPRSRSGYIVHTRKYVQNEHKMDLRNAIESISDFHLRRDFFAANPGIKGIGYKETSHYVRTIAIG